MWGFDSIVSDSIVGNRRLIQVNFTDNQRAESMFFTFLPTLNEEELDVQLQQCINGYISRLNYADNVNNYQD